MLADSTKGAYSPIQIEGAGHGSQSMMMLAVLIIAIIFIFVIFAIFAFKDHKRGGEGIAEIAALGMINKNHGVDGYAGVHASLLAHDNSRDNLREFGELKKEVALTTANSDAKNAQYFYQTQKEIDQARFDNYKATKESEERVLDAIKRSEIDRLRDDNLLARLALQPRPHFAPTPVFSNVYASNDQNVGGHGYAW